MRREEALLERDLQRIDTWSLQCVNLTDELNLKLEAAFIPEMKAASS